MGMRSRKYQHPLWCRGPGWCHCRGHSGRQSSLPSCQTQLPHRSQLKVFIIEATFDPGWYQQNPPHPPMHGYFLHTWGKLSDHVSTTQMSSQALSMRSQPSLMQRGSFWGDELLLARSSRIFVMTRPLSWAGLGAAVHLYSCAVVEYRCTLVE